MKMPHLTRPTWLEIDLGALAYNYRRLTRLLGRSVIPLCVVKADAYGHGLIPVAQTLTACGAQYLGVCSIEEGIMLRRASIHTPIIILEHILPDAVEPVVDYNLTQTVCTMKVAVALNRYAQKRKRQVRVHIKVDTGMGRLGVWHREAFDFIKAVKKLPGITLEGVYSHLSSADCDREFTEYQIRQFEHLIARLGQSSIRVPFFHIANSIGTVCLRNSHLNMVRLGLMLYGVYPDDATADKITLKPVMSLKSKITYLKRVPSGRSISYGRTFITSKPTTIATIPVGYKDGYPRSLSNKAEVLVGARRCRVIGRVCMDQLMVDVSAVKGVTEGDCVTLLGCDGREVISAEELASLAGTIGYEIVCSIGSSVKRWYKYSIKRKA